MVKLYLSIYSSAQSLPSSLLTLMQLKHHGTGADFENVFLYVCVSAGVYSVCELVGDLGAEMHEQD